MFAFERWFAKSNTCITRTLHAPDMVVDGIQDFAFCPQFFCDIPVLNSQGSSMFCPYCGDQNANAFGYCNTCGKPMVPVTGVSPGTAPAPGFYPSQPKT